LGRSGNSTGPPDEASYLVHVAVVLIVSAILGPLVALMRW